ncbi:MAG TPA: DUF3810 family protein [Vicinamibacterales bacterium]|nr:DUF3810 family protein [Vicinamibacterales bacterium]
MKRAAWMAAFAIALIAALLPLPPAAVERWYSHGIFPPLQRVLTAVSNLVPFALFDVLWIGGAAAAGVLVYRSRAYGWKKGTLHVATVLACVAAASYLAFLAAWGLNYRRLPLSDKVVFEEERITAEAHAALGDRAVATLNAEYVRAHERPLDRDRLLAAFQDAHRVLGGSPIVPGVPKPTLLGWYFHKASIAGMTNPFLLETLLAPDLLDVELPFVIAHEWAHLAGYADESEANFVAYLTCQRADAGARYSAALMLIGYAPGTRPLKDSLDIGPKIDLVAIRTRYAQTSGVLRFAARESYDRYLKANRVEKGIESYDAVVQLILGTPLDAAGNPRLR